MALKIKKKFDVYGDPKEYECYTVITRIEGEKTFLQIEVEDRRYDKQDYVIQYLKYNFVPMVEEDSENFIRQGYLYLKGLDEYAGAVDC